VRGWLVRILQRVTSDHYRTHLRRQTLLPVTRLEDEHSEILASHHEGPLEALISRCSDERVEHALGNFPGSSRRSWSYTTSRGSNTTRWSRSWRSPSARS
jgi:DNA-directed RNA polymerase specialized sigma24 family protein